MIVDGVHAVEVAAEDRLGYQRFVHEVEALTLARAETPDAILLDLMMSDLDGRDACRELEMDDQPGRIPVVLFSSAEEYDVRWRSAGADAFLQKPFEIRALPAFVRRLIEATP